jgi:predicted nicotinamide N-methyase
VSPGDDAVLAAKARAAIPAVQRPLVYSVTAQTPVARGDALITVRLNKTRQVIGQQALDSADKAILEAILRAVPGAQMVMVTDSAGSIVETARRASASYSAPQPTTAKPK